MQDGLLPSVPRGLDGKPTNFVNNVEAGVMALGKNELDQVGSFSTLTQLLPEYHLPFYCKGADWFARRLKELPRRLGSTSQGLAVAQGLVLKVIGLAWRGGHPTNFEAGCERGPACSRNVV